MARLVRYGVPRPVDPTVGPSRIVAPPVAEQQVTELTLDLADTLALADSLAGDVSTGLSETLALGDAIAKAAGRTTDDTVGLADAVNSGGSRETTINDLLALSDA